LSRFAHRTFPAHRESTKSLACLSALLPAHIGLVAGLFADVKIGTVEEQQVYTAIGEDGFRRLIAAFYRQIPQDEILGLMYPSDDLAGAEQRLRDFLIFRFGGPPLYVEQRGHPRLRLRHSRFAITAEARERWLQLMHNAFAQAQLPPEPARILQDFFSATATFLMNRPS
jgi:hemoglobin